MLGTKLRSTGFQCFGPGSVVRKNPNPYPYFLFKDRKKFAKKMQCCRVRYKKAKKLNDCLQAKKWPGRKN